MQAHSITTWRRRAVNNSLAGVRPNRLGASRFPVGNQRARTLLDVVEIHLKRFVAIGVPVIDEVLRLRLEVEVINVIRLKIHPGFEAATRRFDPRDPRHARNPFEPYLAPGGIPTGEWQP